MNMEINGLRANNKIINLFLIEFINHIDCLEAMHQTRHQSLSELNWRFGVCVCGVRFVERLFCVVASVIIFFRSYQLGQMPDSHNFYSICIFGNHII